MASVPRLQRVWLLVGAAALATSCVRAPAHPGARPESELRPAEAQGPPPWAPAHGQRRKQGAEPPAPGMRIVFDSDRGVHVVVGLSDHYWDAGRYYRLERGFWHVATHLGGPWIAIEAHDVPLALVRAATSKDVYPAQRAD